MKKTSISKQDELLIVQHYKTHTARSTAKYFHIRPSRLNKILEAYGIEKHPMTVVYEQEITKKELLMRKMQLISCVLRPKSISLHQGDTVNEMQDKLHAQIE